MYSLAPRCSEAWSPMSTPAWRSAPPSAASAPNETSAPASSTAALRASFRYRLVTIPDSLFQIPGLLVMRRHPFRHRPGLVEPGPHRHRDEEREVEERSEEHTSELQSLMRISYAVFCLKKKKSTQYIQRHLKES